MTTSTANPADYQISNATRRHLASQNLRPAENREHENHLRRHGIGRWTLAVEGELLWVYDPDARLHR